MNGNYFAAEKPADLLAHERLVLAALLALGVGSRRDVQELAFPGVSEIQRASYTGHALTRLLEKGLVEKTASGRWRVTSSGEFEAEHTAVFHPDDFGDTA